MKIGPSLTFSIAFLDPMMVVLQFVTQKPPKLLSKQNLCRRPPPPPPLRDQMMSLPCI